MSAVTHKLVAISGLALRYNGGNGTDLLLRPVTKLGRSVVGHEGYRFPVEWGQISGHHCKIYKDLTTEPPVWFVEDSSTNGTFVNGARVPKFQSMPLKEGDIVRLSIPPNEVLEYQFVKHTHADPAAAVGTTCATPVAAGKRKPAQFSEVTSGSEEQRKKQKLAGAVAAAAAAAADDSQADLLKQLSQLERSNAQLRQRLEASRAELDQQRQQMQAERIHHHEAIKKLEHKLEEGEKKNRESKVALSEAASLELAAAKLRAEEAETKVQELTTQLAAETETRQRIEKMTVGLQATVTELRASVSRMEQEKAAVISTKEVLQKRVEELQGEVQLLEERVDEEAGERQKAQEELTRLGQQLEAEQQSAAASKKVAETSEREMHRLQQELEAERKLRRQSLQELHELQLKNADLKRRLECVEEKLVGKVDKMLVQKAHIKAIHTAHCHAQVLHSTLQQMMDAINQQLREALSETDDVLTQAESLPHAAGAGSGVDNKAEEQGDAMDVQMAPATLQMADADMTQPQDLIVEARPASSSAPPSRTPAPVQVPAVPSSTIVHPAAASPTAAAATQLADGTFPMPSTLAVAPAYQPTPPLTANPASLTSVDPTLALTTQPQLGTLPLNTPLQKTPVTPHAVNTLNTAVANAASAGPTSTFTPTAATLSHITLAMAPMDGAEPLDQKHPSHAGNPASNTAAHTGATPSLVTPLLNSLVSPVAVSTSRHTPMSAAPALATPLVAHPPPTNATTPHAPSGALQKAVSVNSSQGGHGDDGGNLGGTPLVSNTSEAADVSHALKCSSPSEDRTMDTDEHATEAAGVSSEAVKEGDAGRVQEEVPGAVQRPTGHRPTSTAEAGGGLKGDGMSPGAGTRDDELGVAGEGTDDAEDDVTDDCRGDDGVERGQEEVEQVSRPGGGSGHEDDRDNGRGGVRGKGFDNVVGSGGLGFLEGQQSEGFGFGQGLGGGIGAARFGAHLDCLVSTEEN